MTGAQFEIVVDGAPRSYRDTKTDAVAAADFLKNRNPHTTIAVKDLQTGVVTMAIYKPDPDGTHAATRRSILSRLRASAGLGDL